MTDILTAGGTMHAAASAAAAVPPLPPHVPVPLRDFATPTLHPRPGCFYRIQFGGGGLLTTAGKAYGVGAGRERLKLAEQINDHPYNHRFWINGKFPFEGGQVDFNPRFTANFEDQVRGVGNPPRAPSGRKFAIIWIPPLNPPPKPKVRNSTEPFLLRYWSAAARNAFDAWQRLEHLASMPEIERHRAWATGEEQIWFGKYSPRAFRVVHRRMSRIEEFFRRPTVTIKFNPKMAGFGRASPAVNRITLGKEWINSPSDPTERTQTFIHEAAHIVGLTIIGESKWYQTTCSRCLAQKSPFRARRNADNFGYYAMSQAIVDPLRNLPVLKPGDCAGCT